jgi:ribosomal-protein-alanine N-acetyltransferase
MTDIIVTPTLRLEPIKADHALPMFAPMSAPEIYDHIPGNPPTSVAALRERYATLEKGRSPDGRDRWLNWVVRLPTAQCAGYVQATIHPQHTADFGFVFAPAHWGKGIAFEACAAVLPWLAREAGVVALYATVDPRNARSLRLIARLGFVEVAAAEHPHGDTEPDDRVFLLACSTSRTTRASSPPSSSSS